MKTGGIVALGLVIGLVAGILLTEVVARPVVAGDGEISTGLAIVLGMIVPVCAIAGAIVAVKISKGTGSDK